MVFRSARDRKLDRGSILRNDPVVLASEADRFTGVVVDRTLPPPHPIAASENPTTAMLRIELRERSKNVLNGRSIRNNAAINLLYFAAFLYRNRHLLHNFQAKALESGDVHGRIRQQPDPMDAQV